MNKGRLEAFTDGVMAIITIMVLELKVPHAPDRAALWSLRAVLLSYVLSFVYVGIYWNNHHHMFHLTQLINGRVLWANLHLLIWISLFPFVTAWMSENHFAALPVAVYGVVLLMASLAWPLLQSQIVQCNGGRDSKLALALGLDRKGKISIIAYLAAIALAFVNPWIACGLYVAVAALWFVPDRRFERAAAA